MTSTTNVIDMELNFRTPRMVYEFGSALRQRPPGCMKIGPGIGPIFVSKVYETPQAGGLRPPGSVLFGIRPLAVLSRVLVDHARRSNETRCHSAEELVC